MPRKKAEVQVQEVEVLGLLRSGDQPATDEALMERYFALKDWITSEDARYKAHVDPHKKEMDGIEQEFLKRLNDRGADSTKSDHGTAYTSTLLNVSVSPDGPSYAVENNAVPLTGRDALLEAALEHWNEWGSDMLMIGAQKDAVKKYLDDHEGKEPPGVKTSRFTRVNIRRS